MTTPSANAAVTPPISKEVQQSAANGHLPGQPMASDTTTDRRPSLTKQKQSLRDLRRSGSGRRSTGTSGDLLGTATKLLAMEDSKGLTDMAQARRNSKSGIQPPGASTPASADTNNMVEKRPSLTRVSSKQAPGLSGRRHSMLAKDSPAVVQPNPESKQNAGASPTQTGSTIGSPISGATHSSVMSNSAPPLGIQLQNASPVVVSKSGPCCSIG